VRTVLLAVVDYHKHVYNTQWRRSVFSSSMSIHLGL